MNFYIKKIKLWFKTHSQPKEYTFEKNKVNVVKKAAIRKPVTKLTTLKLGADYEVKVLNPEGKDRAARRRKRDLVEVV